MKTKRNLWISGIVLAVAGVIVARVFAIRIASPGPQFAVYLVGALLAVAGLVVVMYAIRRKE